MPCLPHPSSCAAPKSPCAAAVTQQPCELSMPLAPTEGTWTFALPSSCPLQENGFLASACCQAGSPRCEGSEAVRHGGTTGAGTVQRAAAHRCFLVPAGFQTPFPGDAGHSGGWGRRSRALSGPAPLLSPSMLLLPPTVLSCNQLPSSLQRISGKGSVHIISLQ